MKRHSDLRAHVVVGGRLAVSSAHLRYPVVVQGLHHDCPCHLLVPRFERRLEHTSLPLLLLHDPSLLLGHMPCTDRQLLVNLSSALVSRTADRLPLAPSRPPRTYIRPARHLRRCLPPAVSAPAALDHRCSVTVYSRARFRGDPVLRCDAQPQPQPHVAGDGGGGLPPLGPPHALLRHGDSFAAPRQHQRAKHQAGVVGAPARANHRPFGGHGGSRSRHSRRSSRSSGRSRCRCRCRCSSCGSGMEPTRGLAGDAAAAA